MHKIEVRLSPDASKAAQRKNALQLAYVGDTIYDLYARTHVLLATDAKVTLLHRQACSLVNASAQSAALARIEPMLTQEEQDVALRGRNAHTRPPKNADPGDYARATAMEALLGYLYLSGRSERVDELMRAALPATDAD